MSDRSHEREARLAPVIAGDVSENDETVASLLESDPALATRIGELRATARTLDDAARWRDDVLAELETDAIVPGLDRVTPVLLAEAGIPQAGTPDTEPANAELAHAKPAQAEPARVERGPLRPSRAIPREALAAAALLIALAGGWLLLYPQGPKPSPGGMPRGDEIRLSGSSALQGISPIGDTSLDGLEFRWESSVSLPPAGYFEVRVYAGESPIEERRIGRSPRLDSTRWKPAEDERSRWKGILCWEVHAFDANAQRIAASEVFVFSIGDA